MKLFFAPPSPFARKVRIVARERGLMDRIEEVEVNPLQDDARLLAANPAGLVPALLGDDGLALIDSPLICEYLDAIAPGRTFLAKDGEDRWQDLNHAAVADCLMDFAVAAIYEKRRTDVPPSDVFIARRMHKIDHCLMSLPARTADPTHPTFGDIATGCALGYLDFRYPGLDWRTRRPDLATWHDEIDQRPAFQATRPA